MNRSARAVMVGVLLLGLAVVAVHQRLRVTFLGYEVRRLRSELDAARGELRRLQIEDARRTL